MGLAPQRALQLARESSARLMHACIGACVLPTNGYALRSSVPQLHVTLHHRQEQVYQMGGVPALGRQSQRLSEEPGGLVFTDHTCTPRKEKKNKGEKRKRLKAPIAPRLGNHCFSRTPPLSWSSSDALGHALAKTHPQLQAHTHTHLGAHVHRKICFRGHPRMGAARPRQSQHPSIRAVGLQHSKSISRLLLHSASVNWVNAAQYFPRGHEALLQAALQRQNESLPR